MKGGMMGRLSRVKWCFLGCLIILLVFVTGSFFMPDRLADTVGWLANSAPGDRIRTLAQPEDVNGDKLIEMVVETVGLSKMEYQPMVVLKEKDGELYLPIMIGLLEANAISVVLEGTEMPRPITADLLCSIIDKIGANVEYIIINDLKTNTFYATIILSANWRRMEIDARPSDAIAVALRVRVPIYVERVVLEKAGVRPEQEIDKYTTMVTERKK